MVKEKLNFNRDALLFLMLVIIIFISFWCVCYQSEFFIVIYALMYMNIKLNIKDLKDEQNVKSN